MNYSDLCKAFYIRTTSGGLKNHTSQQDISLFFVENAINSDEAKEKLPTSTSSYDKWYSGETSPKKLWKYVKNEISTEVYVEIIKNELDENNIEKVGKKLGIKLPSGEKINDNRLAISIARVMYDLAENRGESKRSICDYYVETENRTVFDRYIEAKRERYSVMKLLGGEEVNLEDYFVCNTISDKRHVWVERYRSTGRSIDNATLKGIRELYANRGFDNRKVVLLGSGGSGKTLMLQHMFLQALDEYPTSKVLPVFLELRNYTQSMSINGFIAESLNVSNDYFDENRVHESLLEGKLILLFDGLDEIDPSDIDGFHKKLIAFAEKYIDVQIVVASRDCEARSGLKQFIPLYVLPFNNIQSMQLVDKILTTENNMEAKPEIINYLENGFIKKNGVFASHPMMLTFVAINYPKFNEFNNSHLIFYQRAYEAMLTGHDDNKKPYDRVFRSVDDSEKFTKVFAEFCAKTYEKGVHEFDAETFGVFFESLSSYRKFNNTHKMNIKNFKQDACSTACMMYEEDEKVYYIDPGFQKYLFAHYYLNASSEETRKMGEILSNINGTAFDDFEALDMLYERETEKIELCVILPFLQEIYRGKEDKDSFLSYLIAGYDRFAYTIINMSKVKELTGKEYQVKDLGVASLNETRTVLLDYILRILKKHKNAIYISENKECCIEGCQFEEVYGRYELEDGQKTFSLSSFYSDQMLKNSSSGCDYEYIFEDDNTPAIFGTTYSIDTLDLEDTPDRYRRLIGYMMQEENDFLRDYLAIKSYYANLLRKKRRSKLY